MNLWLILFLVLGLIFITCFYSKPAVIITQSKIEKNIPIKIDNIQERDIRNLTKQEAM